VSVSGSFVDFRGRNIFPALIRKTEAKPIRAFLTTGTKDMENSAGDWTLVDMEMDKALKFSGYDYQFHTLEGGHTVGWKEYFAEAMRFLWKGWPSPVKAGVSAPRVRDIILPDEPWQLVKRNNSHNSNGFTSNSKGELFFADTTDNKIYRIAVDGSIKEFISDAGFCNGLSFGPKDELYTASLKTGKIICYNASGAATLYAENIYGRYILAKPDGGLYVIGRDTFDGEDKVWLIKDGGKTLMDDELKFPRGITMTSDRGYITIGEGHSRSAYSYQITPDGKLTNKERFFYLHSQDWEDNASIEMLCYDLEGHLYVATRYGIQICAWDGPTQVILPLPDGKVSGICFGGVGLDTLFAFCGEKIFKRKVKNHALGAFTPWTAMKPGKL
jgi:sugar lactone lactonase YvrE